jgi:hypothetical protein
MYHHYEKVADGQINFSFQLNAVVYDEVLLKHNRAIASLINGDDKNAKPQRKEKAVATSIPSDEVEKPISPNEELVIVDKQQMSASFAIQHAIIKQGYICLRVGSGNPKGVVTRRA